MWCCRKTQKISWTDRVTNGEVLERIFVDRYIEKEKRMDRSYSQTRRVVRTHFGRDG